MGFLPLALLITLQGIAVSQAGKVCYSSYGCFTDDPPFDRTLVPLPQSPRDIGTRLLLYTQASPDKYEVLSDADTATIEKSSFLPHRTTRFIVHGYAGLDSVDSIIDLKGWWGIRMKDELLRKSDDNVIIVDWIRGAKIPYVRAVANTRLVGAQVAAFMKTILSLSGSREGGAFHSIGFSLGAHISGYVGQRLKRIGRHLDRITGLDPATLMFKGEAPDVRLDRLDAQFVDVIHTSYVFGITAPHGHMDFYPNGGTSQRGCSLWDGMEGVVCHHIRAAEYFIETINPKSCPWRSYRCGSKDEFDRGKCMSCASGCPSMGYKADKFKHLIPGMFYLDTAGRSPFCVFHYRITFYTDDSYWPASLDAHAYVKLGGDLGSTGEIKLIERKLEENSVESFVARASIYLGKLQHVTIYHKHLAEFWKVKKVVVRAGWSNDIYTACFNEWIHYKNHTQKALTRGYRSC